MGISYPELFSRAVQITLDQIDYNKLDILDAINIAASEEVMDDLAQTDDIMNVLASPGVSLEFVNLSYIEGVTNVIDILQLRIIEQLTIDLHIFFRQD